MKKYEQPTMIAVNLLHDCRIMAESEVVYRVTGDSSTGLIYGNEGGITARVKDINIWDEEW